MARKIEGTIYKLTYTLIGNSLLKVKLSKVLMA